MSKYDWSGVPSEVNFIATDDDGVANGFVDKPSPMSCGLWSIGDDYKRTVFIGAAFVDHFQGDWKDSLEERPR